MHAGLLQQVSRRGVPKLAPATHARGFFSGLAARGNSGQQQSSLPRGVRGGVALGALNWHGSCDGYWKSLSKQATLGQMLNTAARRGAASHSGRGDVAEGDDDIDETWFHAHADEVLNCLHDVLVAAELDCVDDLIFDDGVLNITMTEGGTFVINKHYVTKQIWYASPNSGALYFSPQKDGTWTSRKDGRDIVTVFTKDFTALCEDAAEAGIPEALKKCQGTP
eukprot:TRINITY_DN43509_c0_g1_i2.p1 TRINITY_DN43509_c0_g1~~TRINITY_DN43509_c0_g1_i2.p1  ORF type:complete len:223 (-),score=51.33 TRINITY_DN43509_c0_g1_i2:178-846(-)